MENRKPDKLRKSLDRGQADHGWLRTSHSFSFAEYYDPQHMGYGALRVINEDYVNPGYGFGMHAHKDMEIITLVLAGQLQHKDSMGHSAIIGPYEVQRITAGTGMRHSEHSSGTETTHLIQIWIIPHTRALTPSYEQKSLPPNYIKGQLSLIASPSGGSAAVKIHQDAYVYYGALTDQTTLKHDLAPSRMAYVQLVKGNLVVNGHDLSAGDALMTCSPAIILKGGRDAEVMLFDLPQDS